MHVKISFVKSLKLAVGAFVGAFVGSAAYQLINHPDATFDVYRSIFTSLTFFILAYVFYYFKPNKDS